MPPGRKPLPTNLKLVAGVAKNRINDDEPQPEEGVPQCPSADPAVREVWEYTVRQLSTMRVLTMADRDLLFTYCQAVAQHRQASYEISRDGTTVLVEASDGVAMRVHPALRVQREAAAIIKQIGTEFGMTPAARSRIKVGDQAPKEQERGAARLLSS